MLLNVLAHGSKKKHRFSFLLVCRFQRLDRWLVLRVQDRACCGVRRLPDLRGCAYVCGDPTDRRRYGACRKKKLRLASKRLTISGRDTKLLSRRFLTTEINVNTTKPCWIDEKTSQSVSASQPLPRGRGNSSLLILALLVMRHYALECKRWSFGAKFTWELPCKLHPNGHRLEWTF